MGAKVWGAPWDGRWPGEGIAWCWWPADRRPSIESYTRSARRAGWPTGVTADLGDQQAIYPLAGQAAALIGPIEVLVHNASTLGPTPLRLLMDSECEDLLHTLEVNLVGPFRLTKALVGHMALVGRGLVLHVSSDAAVQAYPRWGGYGVSKAALDHLSRTWAAELAEAGVRVLAVDPGEMNTAMHHAALPEADRSVLLDPAQVAERLVKLIEAPARWPSGGRVVLSEVRS